MKSCNRLNLTTGSASIILSVIFVFSCLQAVAEEWSAEQKEVWKMQEAVWSLWKKGDVEGVLASYHDDCTLWYYRATFTTDKGYVKQRLNYNKSINFFELEPQDVKIFDNFAIVQYSIKYNIVKEHNERRMTTWMKQNGKWLIIGSMIAKQRGENE